MEIITKLQLDRLLDQVTSQGVSISSNNAQNGHAHSVTSPAAVIEPADRIIWWGFVAPGLPAKWPWSPQEIIELSNHGVNLMTVEQMLQNMAASWLKPILSATRQLVLVMPRVRGTENVQRHPLWDQIVTLFEGQIPEVDIDTLLAEDSSAGHVSLDLDTIARHNLPRPQRWWTLPGGKHLGKRDVESYSSLDTFIKSPYQWVLRYKARLRAGSLVEVVDDNRQKGNILHRLLKRLFEAVDLNWQQASKDQVKTWIENEFMKLLKEEGANYLMLGKSKDREELLGVAVRSALDLIDHLQNGDIQKVEMEKPQDGHFLGGPVNGFIDMLITDSNGKEAIIDLKWGSGRYKKEELENNEHLQLAVYAHLRKAETGHWPALAYYILSEARMLAQDRSFFSEAEVCQPDENKDVATLWQAFEETWKWRRDQLDEGLIELTVEGTEADDNLAPPAAGMRIEEFNDRYNDFDALTGWTERL